MLLNKFPVEAVDAIARQDQSVTQERLAAAHRAGMQAVEPIHQHMFALASTATRRAVVSAGGELISSSFDDEMEAMLAALGVEASEVFSLAVNFVLKRGR